MKKLNDFFVIGTDTDVGKTYVCGLLVKALENCGYYKAAISGNDPWPDSQELIPGDVMSVCKTAGLSTAPADMSKMVSYVYKEAYSPHFAAKVDAERRVSKGLKPLEPLTVDGIMEDFTIAAQDWDSMVWEGAGGLICPLREDDEEEIYLTDLIQSFVSLDSNNNPKLLLVSKSGLGAINSCVLTNSYLKNMGLSLAGIIMNYYEPDNPIHKDNRRMIEKLTRVPVIDLITEGQSSMNITSEFLHQLN